MMKPYIRIIFLTAAAAFILNRFVIKPWQLAHDIHPLGVIIVNSLPNFFEAIMGTILLAGIGLEARSRFGGGIKDDAIYVMASFLAALYVFAQEFQLHSLGGNNVYDPYDVSASVIGLVLIYRVMWKFGLAK